MASSVIEVRDLTKRFGRLTAVDRISFRVEEGEVFGFLGPNGAGKTTTIRMLTGVLRPDGGSTRISGRDVWRDIAAAKSRIGIVPERFTAYGDLTGWKNLMLTGDLYGVPTDRSRSRGAELMQSFGLFERRNDRTKEYSKGMQQRLMLAMALLHDPEVLVLDEPVSGLDVESRRLIRDRIDGMSREGRTTFLTTHDIGEADRLCDRVAIIHRGRIAAVDAPEALKGTFERSRTVEVSLGPEVDEVELAGLAGVDGVEKRGDKFRLKSHDPDAVVKAVVNLATETNREVISIRTLGPSLEDVFTVLTQTGEE
ncbi:MAG: ABC transporter ATP-binding protein [Gemmatimonadota bacterium]